MQTSCSIAGIVDRKYPGQGILNIADAGFENVFFDMSVCYGKDDLEILGQPHIARKNVFFGSPKDFYQQLQTIWKQCETRKLSVSAAQAPYLARNTERKDLIEMLTSLIQKSILLCGEVGCPFLVIRPLYFDAEYEEEWMTNRAYYLNFAELAQENHVQILLENQCRDINGHLVRGVCSDGLEAAEWVDRLNQEVHEERFGFCMNVGTWNLCGQATDDFIQRLGKRLKAVILRDGSGEKEISMLPFTSVYQGRSQTDWLGVIRGLRAVEFDGQLILDCEDTATAFSPLLQPQLLTLGKAVVEYVQWQLKMEEKLRQYHSIVLFGAGNMCRNYLRCFGDKYPPLFTCANNPASWGTIYCGLEVKPPEALQNLQPDCGVFICNVYYWEIKEQLEAMGVKHIEFFNDEYLPYLVE